MKQLSRSTTDEMSIIEAKYEAQKLAFAPVFFQVVLCLRDMGILALIAKHRTGIKPADISNRLSISQYGVDVLLEAAACARIVEYADGGEVKLTKLGYILKSDKMTNINFDFINDVCYDGFKYLRESIETGNPEGLKVFGNWNTIYEGLSQLPEKAKKSWFDFDHYYSDISFSEALEIVFSEKPAYIFDVGGNTGKWAFQCCNFDPAVRVKILDLPGQLEIARQQVTSKNLQDRIDFHQINVLDEFQKIPQGADAIWMSQFLDCFSPEEIVKILKNAHQAMSRDAFVYILEPFIDNQEFEAASYCLTATSLYFTTMANGNSKMYRFDAMKELVEKSGLEVVESFKLGGESYHTILKCRKALSGM